ncbi:MAG: isoaspartyl peptidase/L-asparaginase [Halobacteriota archaeon]
MHVLAHGGAGGSPSAAAERQRVLDEAVEAGRVESSPRAAVLRAVGVLEASPRFNAGYGGTVQVDGVHRCDAGLMTSDGRVGAVCNVTGVTHPSELARFVHGETPHVLLGPTGAERVAAHLGIDTDDELGTPDQRERFEEVDVPNDFEGQLALANDRYGTGGSDPLDTVGAVATDGSRLAAATSTGGRWLALGGRIGDVPQIGSGFFCSTAAAVSTTGAGEDIARLTLARDVERRVDGGATPREAATDALAAFDGATEGSAGVIVIDATGRFATAYTSTGMQTAVATAPPDP